MENEVRRAVTSPHESIHHSILKKVEQYYIKPIINIQLGHQAFRQGDSKAYSFLNGLNPLESVVV